MSSFIERNDQETTQRNFTVEGRKWCGWEGR